MRVFCQTEEVQHYLAQLVLLNGFQTDPNKPGNEKIVGCSVRTEWLYNKPTTIASSQIGEGSLANPGTLFLVKGWNRSLCCLGVLMACFQKPELLKDWGHTITVISHCWLPIELLTTHWTADYPLLVITHCKLRFSGEEMPPEVRAQLSSNSVRSCWLTEWTEMNWNCWLAIWVIPWNISLIPIVFLFIFDIGPSAQSMPLRFNLTATWLCRRTGVIQLQVSHVGTTPTSQIRIEIPSTSHLRCHTRKPTPAPPQRLQPAPSIGVPGKEWDDRGYDHQVAGGQYSFEMKPND